MRPVLYLAVASLLLYSCKKEDSQSNSLKPIAKIVTRSGSDSTVIEYSFDSQNRFAQEKTTDNGDISTISLVRDGSGRATRVVESVSGSTSGSSVTDYTYLSASDRKLRNGILMLDIGIPVKDSIAFTYATKVSKTMHYYSASGVPSFVAYYYEYSYDGRGNMSQVKVYQPNSSNVMELLATINFEYDTKVNPTYFNDDVLVEYLGSQFVSPNNITKVSIVAQDPSDNFTSTIVYEYGADNRPLKATTTANGASFVSTYTYRN